MKKHRKFKTILIKRSCRKMNRNKQKKFSKFYNGQKKVFHAFFFNFVPQQILNFDFVKLIASQFRQ